MTDPKRNSESSKVFLPSDPPWSPSLVRQPDDFPVASIFTMSLLIGGHSRGNGDIGPTRLQTVIASSVDVQGREGEHALDSKLILFIVVSLGIRRFFRLESRT